MLDAAKSPDSCGVSHGPCLRPQELKTETQERSDDPTRTAGISRFDMDVFVWMAEHVAIRGLDDPLCPEGAHYFDQLPASVASEPFPGHIAPPPAPPRRVYVPRRIECLTAAHAQARANAERQLDELRARQSTSSEETAPLEALLGRLGPYPQPMTANSDEAWHNMRQCATPPRHRRALCCAGARVWHPPAACPC